MSFAKTFFVISDSFMLYIFIFWCGFYYMLGLQKYGIFDDYCISVYYRNSI